MTELVKAQSGLESPPVEASSRKFTRAELENYLAQLNRGCYESFCKELIRRELR